MPIINPMYLYLIEVIHNLDVINGFVFVVLGFVVFVSSGMYVVDEYARETINENKSIVVLALTAFTVSLLIAVLVPTKDTMYKMLIASYVTTDNIQIVNDAIKTNLQDYLNMLGETVKNMR
nr:MAG TPA: hypothetical protein [Caudoviricetes sp.]